MKVKNVFFVIFIILVLVFAGCGGSGDPGSPSGENDYDGSNPGASTSTPNTPTNVTTTATSSSSITISWPAVSGATGYHVYRSTSASGTFTRVGTVTTTSFTDTGLSENTSYYYRVSAYNNAGTSAQSENPISSSTSSELKVIAPELRGKWEVKAVFNPLSSRIETVPFLITFLGASGWYISGGYEIGDTFILTYLDDKPLNQFYGVYSDGSNFIDSSGVRLLGATGSYELTGPNNLTITALTPPFGLVSVEYCERVSAFSWESGGFRFFGDFEYRNIEGGVEIVGYTGSATSVAIPAQITGIPVIFIGPQAFIYKNLTNVNIPNSVRTIGFDAFAYNSLTSISIPNSVITIDNAAFLGNKLTSVNIPNSVRTIGLRAFFFNPDLTRVTIGANVNVHPEAFSFAPSFSHFDNSFNEAYEANSRSAGTYVYNEMDNNWIKQ